MAQESTLFYEHFLLPATPKALGSLINDSVIIKSPEFLLGKKRGLFEKHETMSRRFCMGKEYKKNTRTVFTLTPEAEAGEVRAVKRTPFRLQRLPTRVPPPIAPFPPSSPVLSAGTRRSSCRSRLSLQALLGRLESPETSEGGGGGGGVGGVSGNLGSRGQPLSPSPSRRGSGHAARPPRTDESGEGAGGKCCGTVEGARTPLLPHGQGRGGALGARAPLPVPPTRRGAAGRRHRAHGIPALLPSVVTRRGALGRGRGLAAQASPRPRKTKGTWNREGKSFLLGSRWIQTKPHALSAYKDMSGPPPGSLTNGNVSLVVTVLG
ncbi:uncharacterized protein [Saccopteryx bilineata]|uniref:uncharacterized protein n=1 Tax=Saccopteryx bilineata TaxID=59482 RepID=UPI00338D530B